MNRNTWIALCAGAFVMAGGLGVGVAWQKRSRAAAPKNAARPQGTANVLLAQRSRGNPNAAITVYEFSDFQCPYCRMFWEKTLPAIERDYIATGKVRFVFVNYPVPQLHPNAPAAHNFAMCAARHDKFWEAHDLLYRHQAQWEKLKDPAGYFKTLGDSMSLEPRALASCLESRDEAWLVQSDTREGQGAGITGTPAFIINGGLLPGAQPIEVWRPILDSIGRVAVGEKGRGKREEDKP
jgi:protein-disulfide isomerase